MSAALVLPDLSLVQGHPRASSLAISNHFGKRHDNVLRLVKSLDVPEDWRLLNFEETSVEVSQPNGGTRTETAILMTRDGFTLVVMGFTGKKALEWKLKYIEAFNRMEAELRDRPARAIPSGGWQRQAIPASFPEAVKAAMVKHGLTKTGSKRGLYAMRHLLPAPFNTMTKHSLEYGLLDLPALPPSGTNSGRAARDFWNTQHETQYRASLDYGHSTLESTKAMLHRLRRAEGESRDSEWAKYHLQKQISLAETLFEASQQAMILAGQLASRLEISGIIKPHLK
ncbi:MAG: phage regulatory protein Rha [Desulfovibrionaceae bacterium]|nr:MAG: phage regulatory protein Rha [Desulfovibrionaceae bacterium]